MTHSAANSAIAQICFQEVLESFRLQCQKSWSVLKALCTKDPQVGTCRPRMAPMYLPDPTVSSTQHFPLCSSPSHALQALWPRLMDKYPGRSFTQQPDAQVSVSETGVCTLTKTGNKNGDCARSSKVYVGFTWKDSQTGSIGSYTWIYCAHLHLLPTIQVLKRPP